MSLPTCPTPFRRLFIKLAVYCALKHGLTEDRRGLYHVRLSWEVLADCGPGTLNRALPGAAGWQGPFNLAFRGLLYRRQTSSGDTEHRPNTDTFWVEVGAEHQREQRSHAKVTQQLTPSLLRSGHPCPDALVSPVGRAALVLKGTTGTPRVRSYFPAVATSLLCLTPACRQLKPHVCPVWPESGQWKVPSEELNCVSVGHRPLGLLCHPGSSSSSVLASDEFFCLYPGPG